MARRDVAKWRKILGDDDGRWTRFCHQVLKSPDMREVVLAVAREIDPVYRRASTRPSEGGEGIQGSVREGGEGIRGVGCARAGEVRAASLYTSVRSRVGVAERFRVRRLGHTGEGRGSRA